MLFTSSCGQLLPVLTDYLSKNDAIKILSNLFTRTQPLQSCAFVRMTEHIYYFFVPMKLIDPYFEQQFFGVQDIVNSNDVITDSDSSPSFASVYALPNRRPCFSNIALHDNLFPKRTNFEYVENTSDLTKGKYPSVWQITKVASAGSMFDQYGVPKFFNAVRLLSMLGYGSQSFMARNESATPETGSEGIAINMNPDLLFCYQRIFMDYFRDTTFQSMNAIICNKGWWYKHSLDVSMDFKDLYSARYDGLLTLRYHPLKKDFFTNLENNPLFDIQGINGYAASVTNPVLGDQASALLSAYGVNMQDLGLYSLVPTSPMPAPNVTLDNTHDNVYFNSNIGSDFAATHLSTIRLAYAYERMLAITQRAGRHIEDQYSAHFGGKAVPKGLGNEVYFLGSHSQRLQIGEVVATATSDGSGGASMLGEIAGRGLSSSGKNKPINFTAPCNGYLMAIYAAVPDVDYFDYGTNKINTYVSINAFPHPEFDNIGMQPLMSFQNLYNFGPIDANGSKALPVNDSFLGWQYRWSELKLSYDVIHGAFNSTLSNWVCGQYFGMNIDQEGYLQNYWDAFYVSPNYLDPVLAVPFNGHWLGKAVPLALSTMDSAKIPAAAYYAGFYDSFVYERDPLLHSLDFDYQKVSFMSTYGLPNL